MTEEELRGIFFPYIDERTRAINDHGRRFVYYTSAETAFKIIKNEEIWMRSTSTMNDYMEIDYGIQCLREAFQAKPGENLRRALDSIHAGASQGAIDNFNSWIPKIRNNTFITCVSEHHDDEDENGRLSMWRAYGGDAGIALVLNSSVMFVQNSDIGVFASPVAYWTRKEIGDERQRIADSIDRNRALVSSLDQKFFQDIVFNMFWFAVLCTKHPGFAEEQEWRVIASPEMYKSPIVDSSLQIVGGIPQEVLRLQFKDRPDMGMSELMLSNLLNRIIIGPCENPEVIKRAFLNLLRDKGLESSNVGLVSSDIPLRQK